MERTIHHSTLVLSVWMVAAMVGIGVAVAWEWPLLIVTVLGLMMIAGAVFTTRRTYDQTVEHHEDIMSGLRQLQQLSGMEEGGTPFVEPDALGTALRRLATAAGSRMTNLEKERTTIIAIMENLVEGVVAFDHKQKVVFTNPSAHRILGLDANTVKGQSVWEIIRNQELAAMVEGCQQLDWHERRRAEIELHLPAPIVLEVYALPFPYTHQQKGCVLVLHNVTELRRLEQVRTEFIENVSHELRTPLTAIVGYLETLVDEPSLETPNNRQFVTIAHQHAERLCRLVEDIRSLSEIESGKVVLRCEMVSLNAVVRDISEMFHHQLAKKDLQVSNVIDGEIRAYVDRDRLIQILVNVVDNAIKYSLPGGSISFHTVRAGSGHVALQVKDTGQGIPSLDLPRITERFYRVDRARSRQEGGTGLGLSIVKHLLQLLDGKLRIHSELNKGTTVELILPLSPIEQTKTA